MPSRKSDTPTRKEATMNTFDTIRAAINNTREMYDDAHIMFVAVRAIYGEHDGGDWMIEKLYDGFSTMYKKEIENCFPWLKNEPDYYGAFTIKEALEEMYYDWEEENA